MIRVAEYNEDFYNTYKHENRKVIIYGAGNGLKNNYDKIPNIFIICDRKAEELKEFRGIRIEAPSILGSIKEPVYIIVCVFDSLKYKEICTEIEKYNINAVIFHLFNNVSFGYSFWGTAKSYQVETNPDRLKINIVCQDNSWIFRKFADRMRDELSQYDVEVHISPDTEEDFDINHHIPYIAYKPYPNDTLMITHVDNMKKVNLLKKQLEVARMGICMSKDTMQQLMTYGLPREKLCYINPAHDSVIKPHKYVIGITHKCRDEEDLRKRATALIEALDDVNPLYFRFFIMGTGWGKIVQILKSKGFEIEYYPEFVYDTYNSLMQEMDYFLFMGFDEGAMGYLDALAAGAGTIVTPQGYHLDTDYPIDYPCSTVKQFREAFLDLQHKREMRIKSVEDWTWKNYALKHLEIWNYILHRKSLKEIYKNQMCYSDGIFSVMLDDNRI